MLIAKNIKKSYGSLGVLKGINLEISKGEIISIVGASGAGKSTLLHILGTLDQPDSGTLTIGNQNTSIFNANQMAAFRNKALGFVFQFHNLLPEFTTLENICIPAFIAGTKEKEAKIQAEKLMKILGIADRASHKPSELSGGEQQRASVARALINNPSIIFADEPSGNLDSANAKELHQLFFKLRVELNQSFVLVTHNQELADMADKKYEIKDGIIS
jgi:lipoprotein-releasing system ATP-binding protein